MKNLRFNNTYASGSLTFLFLKEKNSKRFLAVCLELDLEADADSLSDVEDMIKDYANSWLENVRENKLSEELLNRSAPQEFWNIANALEEERKSRRRMIKHLTFSVGMPISTSFFPYNSLLPD